MARLVLSDASPLIALARIGELKWLHTLFGEIAVPEAVRTEVLDHGLWPGQESLHAAIQEGWLQVLGDAPSLPDLPDLDEGEAACIRHAVLQDGPTLILIDERAGRAVAQELGIRVAGTAAVIGMAKTRGLIPSARAIFEALQLSDFRISREVIRAVLVRVGEDEA